MVKALLASAAKAHTWHLATKSYAQHQAFGELYSYLHDAADLLAEPSIGDGMDIQPVPVETALKELDSLCDQLKAIKGEDWLTNITQEIDGKLYQIKYKLKRLS